MTCIDKTASGQTSRIAFEIDLPHAPSKVWTALTTPELLAQWLLPVTGFKVELGSAFTFKAPAFPGWDGRVACRMLAIEPFKRISYAWMVGDMELDTVVTFELVPTPRGTKLMLEQTGFAANQKQNFGGARYGWRMMTDKLVALLASIPHIED